MTKTSFRRRLWKTPMRDLVRGRITGRLDIDRLLEESSLSEVAAGKVRKVVKRTRLWRLEKVDVAHELIAHFLDGIEADTPIDELIETFGNETQTAKLIRRAKKRQRPMVWHAFAWARLCFAVFFGVYFVTALYLMTGSPSVTTDYLAVLNRKAVGVPVDEAAWPIYREALLQLDLYREAEWDSPTPYYLDMSDEDKEKYRREKEMYGGDMMGDSSGEYYIDELDPPYISSRWDRLANSLRAGDPGWDQTAEYLRKQAEVLELIRRAASLPSMGLSVGFKGDYAPLDRKAMGLDRQPIQETNTQKRLDSPDRALINVLLPQLGSLRRLSLLLLADTSRAVIEGDGDTAYNNIVAVLGIAQHADEQPLLINGLFRVYLQTMVYRSVQEVMTTKPGLWSDDQLRKLAHRIAGIEMTPEDWFNGERLWFYDFLQRIYTDDGEGGGRITRQGIDRFQLYGGSIDAFSGPESAPRSVLIVAGLPAASLLLAPRAEMRQIYDGLIDRTIVEFRRPLWLADGSETVKDSVVKMASSMRTQVRYMPITLFFPAMSAMSRAIHTQEGYRDGVLIGIALELYRREHGDWPGALDELVPGYLPSVPVDRLTGEAVRYRVAGDGPVVYSLGEDGDDDGGRSPVDEGGEVDNDMAGPGQFGAENMADEKHDGDWVLWPVPGEG